MKKILFVEDDPTLGFVVKDHLSLEGYEIEWIKDGQSAFEIFEKDSFDLCIFDVMLPKLDGFELAKKVRAKNKQIPILFLTAKSLQEDRLHALRIGADDYLTKPFSIEELVLKMEIFLRRSTISQSDTIQSFTLKNNSSIEIGTYIFDVNNLSLLSPTKKKYSLTSREAELLNLFCQNKEQVLRREFILTELWGDDDYFLGRSLDVFISRLRKYLKEDENVQIENIPRVGFKITVKTA
ncbi:response regulator with CheY-like receiver domain and winged-helix DNA-binding domain [Bernardetia litoralis DSM 6794]|uniref:Response regulator with CheY-like receiver domain and winged-helix DNA-binding domain n=1 Tax=Bernardetia litoralis (strain ATCC 23117 / DSM 6794 / NBRC 15988 / NCIMB 1366 / Fx l1 / Sio-4) TaxID=880071 RepID=I4AI73_BERLS|nr:response regulator transcription factor [Bernardetia litoralis]AFM03658.1 response regulator with CheY-like receiver domain and winged-helix DNA-binding domain [Bernardetia litoralis DSM 6794]